MMSKVSTMPERWSYRPICHAYVYRTEKYVACTSYDDYHGCYMSHTGWHIHGTEPGSEKWLGSNLRKSLLTSKQFNFTSKEWDKNASVTFRNTSVEIYQATMCDIAKTYGYRSGSAAAAKALCVAASYLKDGSGLIKLLATNRKQGGVWDAIANNSNSLAVVKNIPIEATDEELGLAVREMLAISTLSGERVEM